MEKFKDKLYKYIDNPKSTWATMNKKERTKYLFSTLFILFLLAGAILYMIYEPQINEFVKKSSEGIRNAFLKGLVNSIIPILNTVIIIAFTLFIVRVIGIIFNCLKPKTQKSKTAMRLVHSALKYLLFIVMFFLILNSWGVNTAAIIASAGALTLIIGLCVKSIADDLVAGVFLVFEGNVEVGDIITFNGFKGTIREVGLRITKIENLYNDIIVVRNSDLKNYINNSRNISHVIIKLDVPNKFSKEEVEKTLNEIIDNLIKKEKDLFNKIKYDGIVELSASNATYSISFDVFEKKSLQAQNIVNSYIKSAFDKKGYYK